MSEISGQLRCKGKNIGFVPTMGALHNGHMSLISAARSHNDVVIASIFVNPIQFGPREDFSRYPRPLAADLALCKTAGVDFAFVPSVSQIYPTGFQSAVEPGEIAKRWEGRYRAGHFRGVATVITILFELTHPTNAYFGQKDYQQCLIVRRLAQDLKPCLRIHMLPTVREHDGLAMSSRNAYLGPIERKDACVLYRSLCQARARIRSGERNAKFLTREIRRVIKNAKAARIEYAAVVDANTLKPIDRLRGKIAILLAVWISRTRLIDNILVDVS